MFLKKLMLCLCLLAPGLTMAQDLVKMKAGMVAGIDQIGLPIALERGFL
jgi:sulfonate transport system substrate-binding protein